jgi:septation ring formation regulator EzrA
MTAALKRAAAYNKQVEEETEEVEIEFTPAPTLTAEHLKTLRKISRRIHEAKNNVSNIGEDEIGDDVKIGYLAGQAFSDLDRAEDALDELIGLLAIGVVEDDVDTSYW